MKKPTKRQLDEALYLAAILIYRNSGRAIQSLEELTERHVPGTAVLNDYLEQYKRDIA